MQADGHHDHRRVPQNSAVKQEEYKWPGGVLPYEYDSYFRKSKKTITSALLESLFQPFESLLPVYIYVLN